MALPIEQKFGDRMLPSHRRAMQDIETCRTESLGGQLYYCAQCDQQRYSYHSCKNRHCPKCQNEQANEWLDRAKELLLPGSLLPGHLHLACRVASARPQLNQKTIYNLLFRASAASLTATGSRPTLRRRPPRHGRRTAHLDPRLALSSPCPLHRHRRRPHCRRPLACSPAQISWCRSKPLSHDLPRQVRDELKKTELFAQVERPRLAAKTGWSIVSPSAVAQQAFKYLAPYIFRVAISNNRLLKLEDGLRHFLLQRVRH